MAKELRAIPGGKLTKYPDDTPVHAGYLAHILGLTVRRVESLSKEIGVGRLRPAIYPLERYVSTYMDKMRKHYGVTPKQRDTEERLTLKDRLLKVQVQNAELDFEERVGTVTSTEQVEATAIGEGRRTRDAFMRLPGKLAPELAAEKDPHAIRVLLEAEVRATLQDLSQEDVEPDEEDSDG